MSSSTQGQPRGGWQSFVYPQLQCSGHSRPSAAVMLSLYTSNTPQGRLQDQEAALLLLTPHLPFLCSEPTVVPGSLSNLPSILTTHSGLEDTLWSPAQSPQPAGVEDDDLPIPLTLPSPLCPPSACPPVQGSAECLIKFSHTTTKSVFSLQVYPVGTFPVNTNVDP